MKHILKYMYVLNFLRGKELAAAQTTNRPFPSCLDPLFQSESYLVHSLSYKNESSFICK